MGGRWARQQSGKAPMLAGAAPQAAVTIALLTSASGPAAAKMAPIVASGSVSKVAGRGIRSNLARLEGNDCGCKM